jgi:hypothetical protein
VRGCLLDFICQCLHIDAEHESMIGKCRAWTVAGLCPCPAFAHNHDDICTLPDEG